jgi:serine/threonine protein kinase
VALEMEDDDDFHPMPSENNEYGYGRETDWWSLGAMLYEMAYGFAPFFAKDIRQTYLRIMDHEVRFTVIQRSLRFDSAAPITAEFREFLSLCVCIVILSVFWLFTIFSDY